jgi:hypothetical protein
VYMYVSYSERFPETELFHCTIQKIVDKKQILRTVSNGGIYCSSDKVVQFT